MERGQAPARLQQAGFTPLLVKVVNQAAVKSKLRLGSPQGGAPYGGVAALSMQRQDQVELASNDVLTDGPRRFLHLELFTSPPMTAELSGAPVEYALAVIYSSDSGQREATLQFDVGQGTQDLGFRGELPVLFDIVPAIPVPLSIRDHDGQPSYAKLVFRDRAGHVYPPQARRLAPDFFFQPQIYRRDGETVWLPPGKFTLEASRGPEYRVRRQEIVVNGQPAASKVVPADGHEHDLTFRVPVTRSSWIALRHFPQLHTNPVDVLIAEKPIRASADSARWCVETIRQLWRVREKNIRPDERPAAYEAFQNAIAEYQRRAAEAH